LKRDSKLSFPFSTMTFMNPADGEDLYPPRVAMVLALTPALRAVWESYRNVFRTPLSTIRFLRVAFPSPSKGVELMNRGIVGSSTAVIRGDMMAFSR
jgi:hypothetical protein